VLTLNFYGCEVTVTSDDSTLVQEIRRDYAYFARSGGEVRARLTVTMRRESPPYDSIPPVAASFYTPRNVCFRDGETAYVDYFGQGLAIHEKRAGRCTVYGEEFDRVREIAYYFILSTVGQYLDSIGMHRVHALGVARNGKASLLLLPSGGGKSTMALQLMQRPGFGLLGEDTPLIDRNGMVHPFPLRLGIRHDAKTDIPGEYLRTVSRMEFDPKTLIDVTYFEDRWSDAVPPGVILVGSRNAGYVSEIVPLSSRKTFHSLLKYQIVGLGIYQGLEFLLERGTGELWGKGGLAFSRLRAALALMRRARGYRFVLGRDRERNAATLLDFLERQ
jgi:hypothetical protein